MSAIVSEQAVSDTSFLNILKIILAWLLGALVTEKCQNLGTRSIELAFLQGLVVKVIIRAPFGYMSFIRLIFASVRVYRGFAMLTFVLVRFRAFLLMKSRKPSRRLDMVLSKEIR